MRHSYLDNLRLIAEYVYYDDAPALLGIRRSDLTKYAKGRAVPSKDKQAIISRVAGKMRRRAGQLKSVEKAAATRHAKREIHDKLFEIGKPNMPIPVRLPPFLRLHETGKLASPVWIYDFRGLSPTDVMQFFRFMKMIIPYGYYFFTYELLAKGISHGHSGDFIPDAYLKRHKLSPNIKGTFFSDNYLEELKVIHNTKSPFRAIVAEVGTAAAGANMEQAAGGLFLVGVSHISTPWQPFCILKGAGICDVMTDLEFFEEYDLYNNASSGRRVLECGISYLRPIPFTKEEQAHDAELGADPITGLKYTWHD